MIKYVRGLLKKLMPAIFAVSIFLLIPVFMQEFR